MAAVLALAVWVTAASCTYSDEEPGFFPPPASRAPSPFRSVNQDSLERTNPALPVVGETIWTSGEGLQVTTRLAVHAVRRIAGATVVDWSVTPLSVPGLSVGDDVPTSVDLGLTRESAGDVNVFLLDPGAGKVYRPLHQRSRGQLSGCLCSPLWVAQLSLRVGETRMLQAAYPELPPSLRFVTVDLVTVTPFWHVPVTPVDQVPTATAPTDLLRAAETAEPLATSTAFGYADQPPDRLQQIEIVSVTRGAGITSVQWTLTSLTEQPNFNILPPGPPVTARLPADLAAVSLSSASGPQLRGGGSSALLRARWMTTRVQNRGYLECLCTDFGLWASSLRQQDGSATVTTNFPALPDDVDAVDVVLPEVGVIAGLPVAGGADAARRSGPAMRYQGEPWTYRMSNPPRGWRTQDWPTPVPATAQLSQYTATIDDLVALPGW